jgi:hypothetical protein
VPQKKHDPRFYALSKAMLGPDSRKKKGSKEEAMLYKEDGKTLTETPEEAMERWWEHFSKLLNQPGSASPIEELAEEGLLPEQHETQDDLDNPFTMQEMRQALAKCKSSKAMGEDEINIALFQALEGENEEALLVGLNQVWEKEGIPAKWKDVIIKILHKKGDKKDANNFRGISLIISHTGKLMERMIQSRLEELIKRYPEMIPDAQSGFERRRSTMDAILTAVRLAEMALEQGITIYQCYVDLTKAYDTVQRPLLWEVLKRYGVPEILLRNIKQFHEGAEARVRFEDGELSKAFYLAAGLKQGAVFSPKLFSIFFGAITSAANRQYEKLGLGVKVEIKREGNATYEKVDLRKVPEEKKVTTVVSDVEFADDLELVATSAAKLQEMITIMNDICAKYGLTISHKKTVIMETKWRPKEKKEKGKGKKKRGKRGKKGKKQDEEEEEEEQEAANESINIILQNKPILNVETFCYLGRLMRWDGSLLKEIYNRIARMEQANKRLTREVFTIRYLPWNIRLSLFNSCVLSNALYGSNAWNPTLAEFRKIEGRLGDSSNYYKSYWDTSGRTRYRTYNSYR